MKVLWTPTPQNCGQIRWLQNTLIYYKLDLQIDCRYLTPFHIFVFLQVQYKKYLLEKYEKDQKAAEV